MPRSPTVEVCIDSLESAKLVREVMRDDDDFRIELCSNLIAGGGLTPTLGLFRACAAVIDASRIMVMIRPRIGSFTYSQDEIQVMLHDISVFKDEGVKGFVFGCLTDEGEVDVKVTRLLVDRAKPHDVTFHRAFDVTPSCSKAFNDILSIDGVSRILTSGQQSTAILGAETLSSLIHQSNTTISHRKIKIIVASGINAQTFTQLCSIIEGIEEVHLSASHAMKPQRRGDGAWDPLNRGAKFGFGQEEEWKMDRSKLVDFMEVLRMMSSERGRV